MAEKEIIWSGQERTEGKRFLGPPYLPGRHR